MTSQMADDQEMTLVQQIYEQDTEEDNDDEAFLDMDEELQYYKEPNVIHQLYRTRQCYMCINMGLTLCILGSVIALIVMSVQIVVPFHKVQYFQRGMCIPVATATVDRKSCLCGITCNAKYRCVSIKLTYMDQNRIFRNATLYEDESTLESKEVCKLDLERK